MTFSVPIRIDLILAIVLPFTFCSCEDDCSELQAASCADTAPTGPCSTPYESWFFDQYSNSCKKLEYLTCEPHGFETEEECLDCICNE